MATRKWPKVEERSFDCFGEPNIGPALPGTTACKHGKENCETCGTHKRVDEIHHTQGGVGKVGALFKRKKK